LAENGDEVIDCYREAKRCGNPLYAVIVDPHVPKGQMILKAEVIEAFSRSRSQAVPWSRPFTE